MFGCRVKFCMHALRISVCWLFGRFVWDENSHILEADSILRACSGKLWPTPSHGLQVSAKNSRDLGMFVPIHIWNLISSMTLLDTFPRAHRIKQPQVCACFARNLQYNLCSGAVANLDSLYSYTCLRRGIGLGVKGIAGSCAIANSSVMFNYCAIVAPQNPEKQGEVVGNQLLMGTIGFRFVKYCATIASLHATSFTPTPIPLP